MNQQTQRPENKIDLEILEKPIVELSIKLLESELDINAHDSVMRMIGELCDGDLARARELGRVNDGKTNLLSAISHTEGFNKDYKAVINLLERKEKEKKEKVVIDIMRPITKIKYTLIRNGVNAGLIPGIMAMIGELDDGDLVRIRYKYNSRSIDGEMEKTVIDVKSLVGQGLSPELEEYYKEKKEKFLEINGEPSFLQKDPLREIRLFNDWLGIPRPKPIGEPNLGADLYSLFLSSKNKPENSFLNPTTNGLMIGDFIDNSEELDPKCKFCGERHSDSLTCKEYKANH